MSENRRQRATDYGALREEIAARYEQISPQMRRIAEFALRHPNEVAFGTVASIADQVQVQPSSLVRFGKLFGFEGYSDLQQVFRTRLIAYSSSYEDRVKALHGKGNGQDGLLSQFVGNGIAALENLRQSTSEADLAQAVKLLKGADKILIVGQGRAFPVGAYLSYALMRFGRINILLDNTGGTAEQFAALAGRRDALIAISFEPYSPVTVNIAKAVTARGVPVIGISDGRLSPLVKAATVSFDVERDAGQPFRSLVAPMCLAQVLVLSFGQALSGAPKKGR